MRVLASLPAARGETIVLAEAEVRRASESLEDAVRAAGRDRAVLRRGPHLVAVRELTRIWPECLEVLRAPALADAVRGFGVVRAMLIDKPPAAGWSLPWHKDTFIAVRPGPVPNGCGAPTTKRGVLHVDAPEALLAQMIVVRVHLDAVTLDNGPLWLMPGSERSGKRLEPLTGPGEPVVGPAGSAVVYPFLTAHRSTPSSGAGRRRTLHFECAPASRTDVPWHRFDPLSAPGSAGV